MDRERIHSWNAGVVPGRVGGRVLRRTRTKRLDAAVQPVEHTQDTVRLHHFSMAQPLDRGGADTDRATDLCPGERVMPPVYLEGAVERREAEVSVHGSDDWLTEGLVGA